MNANANTSVRRAAILDAALRVFTEHGFDAATIDDVRRRSGASVGSIYHHFGSKEQLAAALYADGLADYQRGLIAILGRAPAAAPGIRALVRHHLRWASERPELARFLLERRALEVRAASDEQVGDQNRALEEAFGAWLAPHLRARRIRRLAPDLFLTILLGPSQEFTRAWLHDRAQSPLARAERALGDAAVAALVTGDP